MLLALVFVRKDAKISSIDDLARYGLALRLFVKIDTLENARI